MNSDGNCRGFGFVEFENVNDATKAIDAVNGTRVSGRIIGTEKKQWTEHKYCI